MVQKEFLITCDTCPNMFDTHEKLPNAIDIWNENNPKEKVKKPPVSIDEMLDVLKVNKACNLKGVSYVVYISGRIYTTNAANEDVAVRAVVITSCTVGCYMQ